METHSARRRRRLAPQQPLTRTDRVGARARSRECLEIRPLALWLDAIREAIPGRARLFVGKVVVDPSNPVAFDANGQVSRTLPGDQSAGSVVAGLLPHGVHYVKAFRLHWCH